MSAKYIMRFDDACPTMDTKRWQKIEDLCEKYNIKPIIAVIPDNKDPKQMKEAVDNDFWGKVQNWQKKGYHIALHGYDHIYISEDSGLVPFNKKSEFAGLSYEVQSEKIKKGIDIFNKKGIKTNIWVAPSHTFDENTLKALREYTDINIVSDGIALFPFKREGFDWIPQQLWHFRKMPFGKWTACFHPNEMNNKEFVNLKSFIEENKDSFINIKKLKYKKICFINIIFEYIYKTIFFYKKR